MTPEQFKDKTKPAGECWIWQGATNGRYGYVHHEPAHRMAFRLFKGPLTPGLVVMHSCDNGLCVNPAHLSEGTQAQNLRDMREKGRHRYGEKSPDALLTEAQVREIKACPKVYGSLRKLADRFGVALQTCVNIRKGRTWRHVQ